MANDNEHVTAETARKMEHAQDNTTREMCETVFYLARYAERLEIDKAISVPDERELLHMVCEWAEGFEREYDPYGPNDHSGELEARGTRWLLETFPYMPELDNRRQAIIDFVRFEEETSLIWPWAASPDEIMQNDDTLLQVEKDIHFFAEDDYDADELYDALNRIVGINPALNPISDPDSEMTMDNMQM